MNLSAPLGFILGLVVIVFGVTSGVHSSEVFVDLHAAAIVIGGTTAAALICLPLSTLGGMLRVFLQTVTGAQKQKVIDAVNEIVDCARAHNEGESLESLAARASHPFLKESLELLVSGGVDSEELRVILEMRVEQQNDMYKREGATYKIIGKFPPAFGLVGATLGMITLLQGLGSPDAFQRLGPSMSVALVATFYGLIFANIFLVPVGENLAHAAEDDLTIRRILAHGVLLLKERRHPLIVAEYLKSYLSPRQRNQMKQAG
jgi:chemotaxis protein MotA